MMSIVEYDGADLFKQMLAKTAQFLSLTGYVQLAEIEGMTIRKFLEKLDEAIEAELKKRNLGNIGG